jgi:hypothetical protein
MTARLLIAGLAAATLLAGCVVETTTQPAPARPAAPAAPMAPSPSGPPLVTTFDGSVSQAAIRACTAAVDAQTDGAVRLVGSEFSQANSAAYFRVGANGAPWRCLVSNRGVVQEVMFIGSEGAL